MSTDDPTCVAVDGAYVWSLPRKLRSPNQIKSGWARHSDTKAWERILQKATLVDRDGTIAPATVERMCLEITRLAPSKHFFLDKDNADFSGKGLVDALKRLGYIVDDSTVWLDGPHISQGVSSDGKYWAIVRLTVAVDQNATLPAKAPRGRKAA